MVQVLKLLSYDLSMKGSRFILLFGILYLLTSCKSGNAEVSKEDVAQSSPHRYPIESMNRIFVWILLFLHLTYL